jgi:hypothetical protein
MRVLSIASLALAAALAPSAARAQDLPEVVVAGPAVIAFWRVPASDSVLEADPDLAAALDEQQYWWAESRPLLDSAGVEAVDRPGRRFRVREPGRSWEFAADPDSAEIGYLVVQPGRRARALYGRRFPDELLAEARSLAATAEGEP